MSNFKEETFNKSFNLHLWKKFFRFAKPYTKKLIILALYMLLIAGFDASIPWLNQIAIDKFIVNHDLNGYWLYFIIYLLISIFQAISIRLMIKTSGYIETGVCYDIRKAGFSHLQRLSFSYYDKTPVGWLMARMTSDINKLGWVISWGIVDFSWGFFMIVIITVIMLIMNVKLALIALSIIPVLIGITYLFNRIILKNHRDVRKNNSLITGSFNEGIMGAKTSKTLVCEEYNHNEFQKLTSEMKASSIRAAVFSAKFMPLVMFLGSTGMGLVMWRGGIAVNTGLVTYGTLIAFFTYVVQIFHPIQDMARILTELQSCQASIERIMSMLDTQPEIDDTIDQHTESYENTAIVNAQKTQLPTINGEIEFDEVSFEYTSNVPILKNFSLKAQKGSKIALVGETGSGKSTIVNLACRFYEPTKGKILFDGIDYTQIPLWWIHSNLGYVLQTPHLFSGSIKENIRYGKLDATDEEIIAASKLTNLHSLIMKFENGYETEVGEGGNMLSTGEKQLVSFARAILSNPAIFVLDEATSSIDTETEHIIQDAILKVLEGRTSFIIAHRLSTIRSADIILYIEKGRIVEQGSHKQLLALKGKYFKLYMSQYALDIQSNSK